MSDCNFCNKLLNPRRTLCPHCYRPNAAPNIRLAMDPPELSELNKRYNASRSSASVRVTQRIADLTSAILINQKVAITRSAQKVAEFLDTPGALYQTYHQQVLSDGRFAGAGATDRIRIQFENAALPVIADIVVFGSLSVADRGQPHFGATTMILDPAISEPRISRFSATVGLQEQEPRIGFAFNSKTQRYQ